jgi:DNA ligase D-like protein (predicted 3'-phosphoesterase)
LVSTASLPLRHPAADAARDNRRLSQPTSKRISIAGKVSDPGLRDQLRSQAHQLGLLGWVRLMQDGTLCVHAEGERDALDELVSSLHSLAVVDSVTERPARLEGHEQFAIRGVPAGVFAIQEHPATHHHFDLHLEVAGVMRSWAVPKGPSLDPSVKRFSLPVDDHPPADNDFEGRTGSGRVIVWDCGPYEQGGRVPWPEALDRGHAVFVVHGQKLRGGFALQRTRGGDKPQWLLIKRRDDYARPGSDIVAERPESVHSGVTLDKLLGGASK